MTVVHRSEINVELFWPRRTSAVATFKASVYSFPLQQILSTSGWNLGSTFAKCFTTNLSMLIMFDNVDAENV